MELDEVDAANLRMTCLELACQYGEFSGGHVRLAAEYYDFVVNGTKTPRELIDEALDAAGLSRD